MAGNRRAFSVVECPKVADGRRSLRHGRSVATARGSRSKKAHDQFRIGIDSQGQIAAADAAAHDHRPVPGDVESAARMRSGEGATGANNGRAISKRNLSAVSMAGKAYGVFFVSQQ
jgi:hypothetical protein